MTDKVAHFTIDGYMAAGATTATFDIPLTTGTLSETEASYMFEINIVGYGTTSCDAFAMRYFMLVHKVSGTFTISGPTEDWKTGVNGGEISGAAASPASPSSTLVRVTLAALSAGDRWWRAFITVYCKDDQV